MELMVRSGLVTACRLADRPTRRVPSFAKATTEGVVRPPVSLGMITHSPPSITATQELVVPRSMPMSLDMQFVSFREPTESFVCPRRIKKYAFVKRERKFAHFVSFCGKNRGF